MTPIRYAGDWRPCIISAKRQIGIYSGTFDPIHSGHIEFAAQVMCECGLDAVIFLPEPKPRAKRNVTKISHRMALVGLAIESRPGFSMLKLKSQYFTVSKTLPELWDQLRGAYLTMLMGSDVALSLERWENIKILSSSVSFAIGLRTGDDAREVIASMERLSQSLGAPIRYTLVSAVNASMSSSDIRAGIASKSQLPARVAEYVQAHGLYRDY